MNKYGRTGYVPRHQDGEQSHAPDRPRQRSSRSDSVRRAVKTGRTETVSVHKQTNGGAEPPRRKTRQVQKSGGNALLYFVIIAGISVILSICIIFSANDIFALVAEDNEIKVSIPQDATVKQVADILEESGVIQYSGLFSLFTKITVDDPSFVMGSYDLNENMDYRGILRQIRKTKSSVNVIEVTIPEGYTVKQIRQLLLDNNICEEADLDEALSSYPFKHEFLQGIEDGEHRLEGYLFPDTYQFYEGSSGVKVINKMLNNFDNKFDDEMREAARSLGYSIQDAVTIASYIEKEAKRDDERATISGVIYNRLESSNYPYLNIDATLLYVTDDTILTDEELEMDSPYNTYNHKGLTPTAIANPGLSSLYAAVHPEEHDYYFYVATGDEEGTHIFSKTIDEHNAAVAQVNGN